MNVTAHHRLWITFFFLVLVSSPYLIRITLDSMFHFPLSWLITFTLMCFILVYFILLYFPLFYFTLLYFSFPNFTLLYFTLLHFTLLYFTLLHQRTYRMFRTLGLRHLCVINKYNQVLGIVTRADLVRMSVCSFI